MTGLSAPPARRSGLSELVQQRRTFRRIPSANVATTHFRRVRTHRLRARIRSRRFNGHRLWNPQGNHPMPADRLAFPVRDPVAERVAAVLPLGGPLWRHAARNAYIIAMSKAILYTVRRMEMRQCSNPL